VKYSSKIGIEGRENFSKNFCEKSIKNNTETRAERSEVTGNFLDKFFLN